MSTAYVCRATWLLSNGTSLVESRLEGNAYELVLEGHTLAQKLSLTCVGHRFLFVRVTPSNPAVRF